MNEPFPENLLQVKHALVSRLLLRHCELTREVAPEAVPALALALIGFTGTWMFAAVFWQGFEGAQSRGRALARGPLSGHQRLCRVLQGRHGHVSIGGRACGVENGKASHGQQLNKTIP